MAARLAARSAARWPSDRRQHVGMAVPRVARRRVRRIRRRRPARAPVAAAACGRCGGRVRGAARAARRAAASLDRRLGLLGLRPHRCRSRCESVPRGAGRVPERSGFSLHRHRLARLDDGLRAGVHARARSLWRARPDRPPTRPHGSTSRSPRFACSRPLRSLRDCRARPALALAFVGWNPLLAVHFAGGGHNDALLALLVVGALAAGAARQATARRRLLGAGIFVKWIPLVLLPLRALEARAHAAAASATSASRSRRPCSLAVSFARYGTGWLHAFGPLARNANHETSWSLPHRLEQLGVPHGVAIGLFAARVRRRVRVARAGSAARKRASRPGDVRAPARCCRTSSSGTSSWRSRSPRPRTTSRRRCSRSCCARTCCARRFRSRAAARGERRARRRCSKTSRQARVAPQPRRPASPSAAARAGPA